jgi:hypothetical protein
VLESRFPGFIFFDVWNSTTGHVEICGGGSV